MFPFNVIEWVKRVLLAGVMSVLIGTIYLGVRWQYWNEIFLQKEKEDQDLFMQANIGGNDIKCFQLLSFDIFENRCIFVMSILRPNFNTDFRSSWVSSRNDGRWNMACHVGNNRRNLARSSSNNERR